MPRPSDHKVARKRARNVWVQIGEYTSLAMLLPACTVIGYLMGHYDVTRLVLRRGVWLAIGGVFAGGAVALVTTRVLEGVLFGVQPLDGVTFLTTSVSLAAIAIVASWLPARRAAGVDPVVAMRAD